MIKYIKNYLKQRAIQNKRTSLINEQWQIQLNITRLKAMGFTNFENGLSRIEEINNELHQL